MKSGNKKLVLLLIVLILSLLCIVTACDEEVSVSPVSKIIVTTLPETNYYVGDEFDLKDSKLTIYRENGTHNTIDLTLNMISNFDSNTEGTKTLTITYEDYRTYIQVYVSLAAVYSIEVNSTEHKDEYIVDQTLDVTNLTILVTYVNGYTDTIPVTADMVSNFNSSTSGERNLTITYGGVSCSFRVNVSQKAIVNVQLTAPQKQAYIVGDTLDLTGGQLFIAYNNNTSEYLNLVDLDSEGKIGVVIDGEDARTFTKTRLASTVTIYYGDYNRAYIVNVAGVFVKSAVVVKDVKDQIAGSNTYDFSDGRISITYNNGQTNEISFNDEMVTINFMYFDLNTVGEYNIKLNIDGTVSLDYLVNVIEATPNKLIITPSSNSYYQNSTIDVTEWTYQILLTNGQFSFISSTNSYVGRVNAEMYKGTGIDTSKVGRISLKFVLYVTSTISLETNVSIDIIKNDILTLDVQAPSKLVYYVNDQIDFTNGKLTVTYANGNVVSNIDITAEMIVDSNGNEISDLSAFTSSVSDNTDVYVKYVDSIYNTSKIAKYSIKVIKSADSIVLLSTPQSIFILGNDFSYADWEVRINYTDSTYESAGGNDFDNSIWTFVNTDFSQVGSYVVRLYYGTDIYLEYPVEVTNDIIGINLENVFIGIVTEGNALDLSNDQLVVTYENSDLTGVYGNVSLTETTISTDYTTIYTFDNDSTYALASSYGIDVESYFDDFYYCFYVDNAGVKSIVDKNDGYDNQIEYYVLVDNIKEVNVSYTLYSGDTSGYVLIASRVIESIEVNDYLMKYNIEATAWDISQLEITIAFNNGTRYVLDSTNLTSNLEFTINGIDYQVEYVDDQNNVVEIADLIALVSLNNSKYEYAALYARVFSAFKNEYVKDSDNMNVYCYAQEITALSFVASSSSTNYIALDNFGIYINENNELINEGISKAFILDSSENEYGFLSNGFIKITYANNTYEYVKMQDVISDDSFGYCNFDKTQTGKQSITIDYLQESFNIAVTVYGNIPTSITVTTNNLTVIEGMDISSDDVIITIGYKEHGAQASDPEIDSIIVALSDITINGYNASDSFVFDQSDITGKKYKTTTITFTFGTLESSDVDLKIYQKSLASITMKVMPKQVYVEDPHDHTVFSLKSSDGRDSTILLIYDNGYTEEKEITSSMVDLSQFNPNIVLSNGSEESQRIVVSYTDDNNITRDVTFNVVIKDRKYLSVTYENKPTNNVLMYEYGTGQAAAPQFVVLYYSSFDSAATALQPGDGDDGYVVTYLNTTSQSILTTWPTDVGEYVMVITYNGDAYNNPFEDTTLTIRIVQKSITISIPDITFEFGTIVSGDYNELASLLTNYASIKESLIKGVSSSNTLTDNPYVGSDTFETIVDYIDLNYGNMGAFTSANILGSDYFIINANVGEYIITPILHLSSDNYIVSDTYLDVTFKLTITKKSIIIVADSAASTYGQEDPAFTFNVYDYVNDYSHNPSDYDVNNKIGNNDGIAYYVSTEPIFFDTTIPTYGYGLSRNTSLVDAFDAGVHDILSGDAALLENYTVYYVGNSLTISKTNLILEAENISKLYGVYNENNIDITLLSTGLKYTDSLSTLIGDYFVEDDVIYYDKYNEIYYVGAIPSNIDVYDDIYILYKNVKFYSNQALTINAFTSPIDGQNVYNNIYNGNYYTYVPFGASCGVYYAVLDITNGLELNNYNIALGDNEYFSYTINSINAVVNLPSLVIAEETNILDSNHRTLDSYFVVEGIDVLHYDYDLSLLDVDTLLKSYSPEIQYFNGSLALTDYKLSNSKLGCTFDDLSSTSVGIKLVTYTQDNSNISITFTSYNKEVGNYYINYYYGLLSERYTLTNQIANYDAGVYIMILPSYVSYDIGNGTRGTYSEAYTHRLNASWDIDTYITKDLTNYTNVDESGISFRIVNNNATYASLDYLSAGTYTVSLIYDFNSSNDGRFIYLGDTTTFPTNHSINMINSIYDPNNFAYTTKYTKTFTGYVVTQANVEVEVYSGMTFDGYDYTFDSSSIKYDGTSHPLYALVTNSTIYSNDTLNLTFNVSATYNGRLDADIYENVPISDCELYYNNALYQSIVSTIANRLEFVNAGSYTVSVAAVGNINYNLSNSYVLDFNITTISIPVYLVKSSDSYSGTRGKVNDDYQINVTYSGSSITNTLSSTWTRSSTSGYLYYSTTCLIVDKYYETASSENSIDTVLNSIPTTLSIYFADSEGEYPVNVDPLGYDVTYAINEDYINYSVVFVYKTGTKFIACDSSHKYKLMVNPHELKLYQWFNVNSKTYDGTDAAISELNLSSLILTSSSGSVSINKSQIVFTFERIDMEESTYIKQGGNRYNLVDLNDIKSAGYLKVSAFYSYNYNITFADSNPGATYVDPEDGKTYGLYTITQRSIAFRLNNDGEYILNKQFDGFGLTNYGNLGYTGTYSDLSTHMTGTQVVDNYSNIYYLLDLQYYNSEPSLTGITAVSSYDKSYYNTNTPYNVGYYWYNLYGVFKTTANEYICYKDIDASYSNWLNWNYTFTSSYSKDLLNGCFGIYNITQREIYAIVNPTSDTTISASTINANIPSVNSSTYTYSYTYDGVKYYSTALYNALQSTDGCADLEADINESNTATTTNFRIGYYIYDSNFINVNSYTINEVTIGDYIDSNAAIGISANNMLFDASSNPYSLLFTAFASANPNFRIINENTRIAIRVLNIDLAIKLVNLSDDYSSTVIFGRESSEMLGFKLNPVRNYPNSNDVNLRNDQAILDNIITANSVAYLNLLSGDVASVNLFFYQSAGNGLQKFYYKAQDLIVGDSYFVFTLANSYNSTTVYYEKYNNGFVKHNGALSSAQFNSGEYYTIQFVNPTEFNAEVEYYECYYIIDNRFNIDGLACGTYSISGGALRSDQNKYSFTINSTDFIITQQQIYINSAFRPYFDKNSTSYGYIFTINGLELNTIEDSNLISVELLGMFSALSRNINDNTRITDLVGKYDNTIINSSQDYYNALAAYYISISNSLTDNVLNTINSGKNYTLIFSDEWTTPAGIDTSNKLLLPLEIKKLDIEFNIRAGNVSYGEQITFGDNLKYDNLPVISGADTYYTYLNGTTQVNEEYYSTDARDAAINIQTLMKNYIVNIINYSKIINTIATSDVSASEYHIALEGDYLVGFDSTDSSLDNFNIVFDNVYYVIKQLEIKVKMKVNKSNYNDTTFALPWTERYNLVYEKDGQSYDTFSLTIQDFTINGQEYSSIGANALEDKIIKIFLTYIDNHYVYYSGVQPTYYNTVEDFITAIFNNNYVIQDTSFNTMTSCGDGYVKISSLSSKNFTFDLERTNIYLYPEIESIGNNANNNGNSNVISDIETYYSNEITYDNSDFIITRLATYIPVNYTGMPTGYETQYINTYVTASNSLVENIYKDTFYQRTNYELSLYVYYVKSIYVLPHNHNYLDIIPGTTKCYTDAACTELNAAYSAYTQLTEYDGYYIDVGRPIAEDEYIICKVKVTETFNKNTTDEITNSITSSYFRIYFRPKSTDNVDYTLVANKASLALAIGKTATSGDYEGFNKVLDNDDANNYYVYDSQLFSDYYDTLTYKLKLDPKISTNSHAFSIGLYENAYGSLSFNYSTNSNVYYLRMIYNKYYYLSTDESVVAGTDYYTFNVSSDTVRQGVKEYYYKTPNGYALYEGVLNNHVKYYEKTLVVASTGSPVGEYYVNYYDSIISDSIIELFDNKSHEITFYLDTIGNLVDITTGTTEYFRLINSNVSAIVANKEYMVYMILDGYYFAFSYIGGGYLNYMDVQYTLSNGYPEDCGLFADSLFNYEGNTYIGFNNLYVYISKLSIKERNVKYVTSNSINYLTNVYFMPALLDDSVVITTNIYGASNIARYLQEQVDSISYMIISGSSAYTEQLSQIVNMTAQNNLRVQKSRQVIDIKGTTISDGSEGLALCNGLFNIKYTARAYYTTVNGSVGSTIIYTQEISLLVTSNEKVTNDYKKYYNNALVDDTSYTISPSSPLTIEDNSGTRYKYLIDSSTSNAPINKGVKQQTIILDNVSIDEGANVWIYLRTSNMNLDDLSYNKDEITSEASGIGLNISRAINSTDTVSKLFACEYSDINNDLVFSTFNAQKTFSWNSSSVYIIKMLYSYETGDNGFVFRLYEYNQTTYKTTLVWQVICFDQQSLKNPIGNSEILQSNIANILDFNFFTGVSLTRASLRFIDFRNTYNEVVYNDLAYYKTMDMQTVLSSADLTSSFVALDEKITQFVDCDTDTSSVAFFTDEYGIPVASSGNAYELDLSIEKENGYAKVTGNSAPDWEFNKYYKRNGKGFDKLSVQPDDWLTNYGDYYMTTTPESWSFQWGIANTSPYYFNMLSNSFDDDIYQQRGLRFFYNDNGSSATITLYFYEDYTTNSSSCIVYPINSLIDGNKHKLVFVIDKSTVITTPLSSGDNYSYEVQSQSVELAQSGGFYMAALYIDDIKKTFIVPVETQVLSGVKPEAYHDQYFFRDYGYSFIFVGSPVGITVNSYKSYNYTGTI